MPSIHDRQFHTIVAIRDLDGEEHGVELDPVMASTQGSDIDAASRKEVEFMMLVPRELTMAELNSYGFIAYRTLLKRVGQRKPSE